MQLDQRNMKELATPGGLTNISLPLIISNAISLCNDLGERYLWIDRLCIVQDDAEEKPGQIAGMDKIYRSATFTIIAALNTRDCTGLPGVKLQPRKSSIWTPARDGEVEGLGIRPNGISAIVQPSLWNKRGWTFQERVLSRRRLFITESQVIFECARGKAYEEMTFQTQQPFEPITIENTETPERRRELELQEQERRHIPAFSKWSRYDPNGGLDYNLKSSTSLVEYFRWVEDYTSRQLSYRSDILNAFAGVGSFLAEALDTHLIFGLSERHLPRTLMWSCAGYADPRVEMPQIPSWSWASSTTHIDYKWIAGNSTFDQDMAKIVSLAYFYFQDPGAGLRKLHVEEQWIEETIAMRDVESNDQVLLLTGKNVPGLVRTKEMWRDCPQSPWKAYTHQILDPSACAAATSFPGALVFNTTVGTLKLAHDTRDIYKGKDERYRDVAICTLDGEQVGWLNLMHRDWIAAHVSDDQIFEFVVICGALADWSSRKMLVKYSKNFDLWRLHVMLVERVAGTQEGFIVRRVDVGILYAHRWKTCNPKWETVVLC